ncbi:hypothetical protein [Methylobacterium persicinum]|uniref:Tail fiber domain-containing protein n=1 Tax=Methylobacterium persicinum TaxID=374426 RepID=A0ABU0HQG1_9HYPH|nr:hypothetical protein [Methylobacterium persicinum]MDQ0444560.1 hypothetical protein [Methylobacterium persicinum]GJE40456.1 hypothetical protein KHHGKMAE_4549 [Methylobacterium persicinum]
MSKKDGGASAQAKQARADEATRQAGIRAGTDQINTTFDSQFNDGFFDKQRQNYLNFQLPQLDDQYGNAQRSLTYALARDGNLDSSTRGFQTGQLQKTYDTARTNVADQAQSYANTARSNVEQARGNLISTLNATGDATQAANSATSQAAILAQPAAYSPLADAFSASASAMTQQALLERNQAIGGAGGAYNTGLFGTAPSAIKTTR